MQMDQPNRAHVILNIQSHIDVLDAVSCSRPSIDRFQSPLSVGGYGVMVADFLPCQHTIVGRSVWFPGDPVPGDGPGLLGRLAPRLPGDSRIRGDPSRRPHYWYSYISGLLQLTYCLLRLDGGTVRDICR